MPALDQPEPKDQGDQPLQHRPNPSRRRFLQAVGATIIGSVATTMPLPILDINASAAPASRDKAWAIAVASPLFQEAIAELSEGQFVFDATSSSFREVGAQGSLVGLLLQHRSSASRRVGASLIMTVDLQAHSLNFVQFIVGWCLDFSLEAQSTIFDVRNQPYRQISDARPPQTLPPLTRPRHGRHWTFARPVPLENRPEKLVVTGWPSDTTDACHWFYDGCTSTEWATENGAVIHRCTQVAEQRSCQPDHRRIVDLVYTEPVVTHWWQE